MGRPKNLSSKAIAKAKAAGIDFTQPYTVTTSTGGSEEASLVADFQRREAAARAANIKREKEIRGIYGDLIAQSETGGAAKVAGLAEIEQGKTKAIGAGTQQMISSGMYGTTTAAAIPVQAENQASLSRLKLEDMLYQRTEALKLGQAGFVERIEEPYPDYGMLVQAMMAQASQQPTAAPAPVSTQPEQSLSDWMRKEFGPPPGGYTPAPGSFNAPSFSSGSKQTKAQAQATHKAKYAHVPDIDWAAAQKKAKKTEEELYQGGWLG